MTKSVEKEDAERIVERLLKEGWHLLVFGMDTAFGQREGVLQVQGVGLKQIASLMKKCKIFLGVDTGLLHLAAALGVCTIALFGPTSPSLTGPYGEGHKVLKKSLPCSPCFKRVCAKRECMRFDEEEILSAIRECR
jgi:ADP-heptose:LPS heptosyltransferase